MEECGGREPGHEGDVFDRVPAPVAAPAEDVVCPPHSKDKACGLQAPRHERKATRMRDPRRVWAAGEKGCRCEAERDGKGGEPGEHDRRVDQHPAVAEAWG